MRIKRLYQFIWIGILVSLSGLLLAANAGASTPVNAHTSLHGSKATVMWPAEQLPAEDPFYILGEPCGAGELLPEWTLCLHGGIALRDTTGQPVWLNNIPLTITRGISAVTGVTFIHPGYITPTYGIDISSLWPEFLEPVTLTANISNTLVERQIIVYPDFRTQSQHFDIVLQDVSVLNPAPLWGYVADIATRGPVTGATVTAEHNGTRVTVTTSVVFSETIPFYAFTSTDLTTLDAVPGDALTVTAAYQNDIDQRGIELTDSPQQANFVTGWKCDGFDPLPRSSGGEGMPRSSGGEGMPDAACFWGYIVVDGQALSGINVHLEISGTRYSNVTQYYPGETLPRYGIGIWGGQSLHSAQLEVTGVYNGYSSSRVVTANLSSNLDQRIDLGIFASSQVLANFTNGNNVRDMVWHKGYLWVATKGGIIRWDSTNHSYKQFTTADGLIDVDVRSIAIGADDALWLGTRLGVSRYLAGEIPEWRTFTDVDGLVDNDISTIAVEADGTLWFGTNGSGVSRCIYDSGFTCQNYTVDHGLASNYIQDIAISIDDSVWFGTADSGASHYQPSTSPTWQTFTTATGLADNDVRTIALGEDNVIWFGTSQGLSRYLPGDNPEWQTFNDEFVNPSVFTIIIEPSNKIWIGTMTGLYYYRPAQNPDWQRFFIADGLTNNDVRALAIGNDGTIWAGTHNGISRYLGGPPIFQTYRGLLTGEVYAVEAVNDETIWFGTRNGAIRYTSGAIPEWQVFTTSHGLIDDYISVITKGTDNTLWLGSQNGVSHYRPGHTPEWESYTTASGLVDNRISEIATAPDGAVWFGTYYGGVSRYHPHETPQWRSFTMANGLASDYVESVAVGGDGTLWLGTRGSGVSRCVYSVTLTCQTFTTTHGLASNFVYAIEIEENDAIWFGTSAGLTRYQITPLEEWQTYMTLYSVRALSLDVTNRLWIGTTDGVRWYQNDTFSDWLTYSDGLTDSYIFDIVPTNLNKIWLATRNGASQYSADALPAWQVLIATDGPTVNVFQTIKVDTNGTLWVGTTEEGVIEYVPDRIPAWRTFTTIDGLASNNVRAIAIDLDDVIWFGTDNGLSRYQQGAEPEWQTITVDNGLVANSISALAISPDGALWVGTGQGVNRYLQGANPEWQTFTTTHGLASNSVESIAVEESGAVWFGTQGYGVSRYQSGGNPEWRTFTTADGLMNNWVHSIVTGKEGDIWFGTRTGASRYLSGNNPEWESFGDGVTAYYDIAIGQDGTAWISAYGKGVIHYDPNRSPQWRTYNTADGLVGESIEDIEIGLNNTLWFAIPDYGITHWIAPISQGDLMLTLHALETSMHSQILTYTIQIGNQGKINAVNTVLTLTLPASNIFLTASLPPSSTTPLIWDLDTLASGTVLTLEVTTFITSTALPGTWVTAIAEVATATPESFLANNSAQASTYIRNPDRADVRITAFGPPALIAATPATYTLCADCQVSDGSLPRVFGQS